MRSFRSADDRAAAGAAETEYRAFVALVGKASPSEVKAAAARLRQGTTLDALPARKRRSLGEHAFRAYTDAVLADDLLTEDEEQAFNEVTEAVGIDDEALQTKHRDLLYRLAIARANDGRLSAIEEPKVLPKKGESVHLEMLAALMKEGRCASFAAARAGSASASRQASDIEPVRFAAGASSSARSFRSQTPDHYP
jgi:hypothetical protein